jgi:hypothetical protein
MACGWHQQTGLTSGKSSSLTQNLNAFVKTKLVLTPLRACWLWNAAGIDLSFFLTQQPQIQAFY